MNPYFIVIAFVCFFYVWERFASKGHTRYIGIRADLFFFTVYSLDGIFKWSSSALGASLSNFSYFSQTPLGYQPGTFSYFLCFLVALLQLDFVNFLGHYLGHRWIPFSTFHKVHHSVSAVNCMNFTRHHFMDVFLRLLIIVPANYFVAVTLGISLREYAYAQVYLLVHGSFIHSDLHVTALEKSSIYRNIFTTPAYHRVHHRVGPAKNIGLVFVFWDKLFKTYSDPALDTDTSCGLSPNEMAVYPQSISGQLLYPFAELAKLRNQ